MHKIGHRTRFLDAVKFLPPPRSSGSGGAPRPSSLAVLVDEVRNSLRGIMQIFPKLAEGDYSEWVDAFEKQIAPTATPIAASD